MENIKDAELNEAMKAIIYYKRARRGEGAILKHSITFRLSDNEKRLIKELTEEYSMSQTEFLRLAIVHTAALVYKKK